MATADPRAPENASMTRRAAAWQLLLDTPDHVQVELRNRLSALPVEVRARGLTTAVAVLQREGGDVPGRILNALAAFLAASPLLPELRPTAPTGRTLLAALLHEGARSQRFLEFAEEQALLFLGDAKLLARARTP